MESKKLKLIGAESKMVVTGAVGSGRTGEALVKENQISVGGRNKFKRSIFKHSGYN